MARHTPHAVQHNDELARWNVWLANSTHDARRASPELRMAWWLRKVYDLLESEERRPYLHCDRPSLAFLQRETSAPLFIDRDMSTNRYLFNWAGMRGEVDEDKLDRGQSLVRVQADVSNGGKVPFMVYPLGVTKGLPIPMLHPLVGGAALTQSWRVECDGLKLGEARRPARKIR